jgi:hypothetical protein
MRPSRVGLALIFLVSLTFTILVFVDALGVVWLVLGPAAGAAVELVASNFGDGAESSGSIPAPEVHY